MRSTPTAGSLGASGDPVCTRFPTVRTYELATPWLLSLYRHPRRSARANVSSSPACSRSRRWNFGGNRR